MKKGDIAEGYVIRIDFPNKGIVRMEGADDEICYATVKNALPGQTISFRISKKKHGRIEGQLLEVLDDPSESQEMCPHASECGGCLYQGRGYEEQLSYKEGQIRQLMAPVMGEEVFDSINEGIISSPVTEGYRNKMELSFGDNEPGGILQLGMHRRGSFYDIVSTMDCRIMDADMRKILVKTLKYFREQEISYYHKRMHRGYLRYLLLRKAAYTGEILVSLVTSSDKVKRGPIADHRGTMPTEENNNNGAKSPEESTNNGIMPLRENINGRTKSTEGNINGRTKSPEESTNNGVISLKDKINGGLRPNPWIEETFDENVLLDGWRKVLEDEEYEGTLTGVLHTRNDRPADVLEDQGTRVLYGRDYFTEKLLGLSFRITPFSFFQTNSRGAELLYEKAREYILDTIRSEGKGKSVDNRHYGCIYDLYSGTGTIAQMLSPAADEVVGVEIIKEAVDAAKENAAVNGLSNCRFVCGDVLKVLDELQEKPDMIVLDPPRDGIHPKALPKLLSYQVDRILYISCKPTSLARDLPFFQQAGYQPVRLAMVDMFPWTGNVEVVSLLQKMSNTRERTITLDVAMQDYYRLKNETEKA